MGRRATYSDGSFAQRGHVRHAWRLALATLAAHACGGPSLSGPLIEGRVYAVEAQGQTQGPADALVTLIEVADFQCPYCRRALATLEPLLPAYGAQLRRVFVHFPLASHERARPAAIAAQCASEQGKFWDYAALLVSDGRGLGDRALAHHAEALALDMGRWSTCLAGDRASAAVEADRQRMLELGVRYTPTFFVNGRYEVGALSAGAFRALIDERLAAAKRAVANGISPVELYRREVLEKGTRPEER